MSGEKTTARAILIALGVMFVAVAAGIGVIFWKFTPFYQVDNEHKQIKLLGGYVQIDGEKGAMRVGNREIQGATVKNGERREFEGKVSVPHAEKARIDVPLSAGTIKLQTSASANELHWKCKVSGAFGAGRVNSDLQPEVRQKGDDLTIDLGKLAGASCEFEVPARAEISVRAISGLIDVVEPKFRARIDIQTGKIGFKPAAGANYRFRTQVLAGMTDPYFTQDPPAGAKDVIEIELRVMNGLVGKL